MNYPSRLPSSLFSRAISAWAAASWRLLFKGRYGIIVLSKRKRTSDVSSILARSNHQQRILANGYL